MIKNIIKRFKSDWKKNSIFTAIIFGCFLVGLITGMSLTEFDTLKQIFVATASGMLLKAPDYLMIFIGIGILAKAIKSVIKKVPEWLEDWEKRRLKIIRIERAATSRY